MRTITLHSALRKMSLAIALGAAALLPLALASCAKSADKEDNTKESNEGANMPKDDGHTDHKH